MALSQRGDVDEAVLFAKVTDDWTRSHPSTLRMMFKQNFFFSSLTLKIGSMVATSWLIPLW